MARRQRERVNVGKSLYCGFRAKEQVRRVSRLGLASLNHFRALGIGAAPGCLVPGLGD